MKKELLHGKEPTCGKIGRWPKTPSYGALDVEKQLLTRGSGGKKILITSVREDRAENPDTLSPVRAEQKNRIGVRNRNARMQLPGVC
jgi:hypothetical protein